MKGNFLDTHADITVSGPGGVQMVVARIDRKLWNVKEIFAGKHTYFLTVAPGMDMACALAMCICLDEREQKRSLLKEDLKMLDLWTRIRRVILSKKHDPSDQQYK